jgi:hypothetical protein
MMGAFEKSAGDSGSKKSRGHLGAAALKFAMAVLLLQCFGDVSGTDAASAGFDGHDAAVFNCSDLLQVRIPYGAGFIVGMAYVVAEAGAFSTDITFS